MCPTRRAAHTARAGPDLPQGGGELAHSPPPGTSTRSLPPPARSEWELFDRSLQELADDAEALLAAPVTEESVLGWLRRFAGHSGTYRGLPGSVLVGLDEEGTPLHASCVRMRDGAARLMARAQDGGRLRADVATEDVLALVAGIAWVAEQARGEGRADRLLALVRDALVAGR